MLKHLNASDDVIPSLSGIDALFILPKHIRSTYINFLFPTHRADAHVELVLLGVGVQIDSQGKIGKELFQSRGLGKLVDLVSPGVVEFTIDKNLTCLISAKTTLRERWQEVPKEMSRTGASKMYLATLDESISDSTLRNIYEQDITIVTTQNIKENRYRGESHVITFERLIRTCKNTKAEWEGHTFTREQEDDIKAHLDNQC